MFRGKLNLCADQVQGEHKVERWGPKFRTVDIMW